MRGGGLRRRPPDRLGEGPAAVLAVGRATENVRGLRVLRQVEPSDLVLLTDPQAHERVEDLQDDERTDEGEHPAGRDRGKLHPYLTGVAVAESVAAVRV